MHGNCLGPEELVAPLTSSPLVEVFTGDCEHLAGAAQCFLGSRPGFGDLRGAAVWVRFPGMGRVSEISEASQTRQLLCEICVGSKLKNKENWERKINRALVVFNGFRVVWPFEGRSYFNQSICHLLTN